MLSYDVLQGFRANFTYKNKRVKETKEGVLVTFLGESVSIKTNIHKK